MKHYPVSALRGVWDMISEGQKTGSLTLNFSQGSLSGTVNWREREDTNLTKDSQRGQTVPDVNSANCR